MYNLGLVDRLAPQLVSKGETLPIQKVVEGSEAGISTVMLLSAMLLFMMVCGETSMTKGEQET
jgi:hypothetical protein